jgi:hypothetical protein
MIVFIETPVHTCCQFLSYRWYLSALSRMFQTEVQFQCQYKVSELTCVLLQGTVELVSCSYKLAYFWPLPCKMETLSGLRSINAILFALARGTDPAVTVLKFV